MAPAVPSEPAPLPAVLPTLPVESSQFIKHILGNRHIPIRSLVGPFREYENALRAYFAQAPDHEFVKDNVVNLVDIFADGDHGLKSEARNIEAESKEEKERYIMPLEEKQRKNTGDECMVSNLKGFRDNFNIFTEGALLNLDWSNIVVAGSAALTPLLVVPKKHAVNKRALREYYHEILAPASDIDLFLYGIDNEKEAIAKLESIEATIKDNLLWETTTIRTHNTITIVSQYPNRHVQVVLRLYKSISQILHGFDVDCSAIAYDGSRVLASPRALAACISQCNDIDLSRRSPSYENRLSKYSRRGFEIYCPFLDRTRIDPTIFERSFARTNGLARLLVMEALPKPEERDAYQAKRRAEMGRPEAKESSRYVRYNNQRNKKEMTTDEVAEWDFEDISSYQRFSIPYGEGYNAKRIEKLFFKKDLLLNADWNKMNKPPHRTTNLHRHPVFIGNVADVVGDCCGMCPKPLSDEDKEIAEVEGKLYVQGNIIFLADDPGRQEIGSFYPLGPEDYTDMAYIGSSQRLCEAIVDNDINFVKSWCEQGGTNVNVRDYCGRTPLHLACLSTSTDIGVIQCLIDHGARLVARLQDGRTPLHLAAARGRADIVAALLKKSAENEHERDERMGGKKESTAAGGEDIEMKTTDDGGDGDEEDADSDAEVEKDSDGLSNQGDDDDGSFSKIEKSDAVSAGAAPTATTSGFVKLKSPLEDALAADEIDAAVGDDIYDINITDWDYLMSPLHHAILGGHKDVMETLVSDFGADIRKPIVRREGFRGPGALLNIVLALNLPNETRYAVLAHLLKLGASSMQATTSGNGARTSALHYLVQHGDTKLLDILFEHDGPGALAVINNTQRSDTYGQLNVATPLTTAMSLKKNALEVTKYLIDRGAHPQITVEDIVRNMKPSVRRKMKAEALKHQVETHVKQPLELALEMDLGPEFVELLLKNGANPNFVLTDSVRYHSIGSPYPADGKSPLDFLREQIENNKQFLAGTSVKGQSRRTRKGVQAPEKATVEYGDSVLDEYPEGSYQRAAAQRYLRMLRAEALKNDVTLAKKAALRRAEDERLGTQLKEEACRRSLEGMLKVEKLLIEAGAKTYLEIHPEVEEEYLKQHGGEIESFRRPWEETPEDTSDKSDPEPDMSDTPEEKPKFSPFHFAAPYLGEGDVQGGYLRLFEAAWRGAPEDLETVRMLTSGPTGEGENLVPALQISISDNRGFNVMYIALLKGHYDMVDLIMQIVKKQYEPEEDKLVRGYDSDDSESGNESNYMDDDPVVDETGAPQNLTACSTSPFAFILRSTVDPVDVLSDEEFKELEAANVHDIRVEKPSYWYSNNWSPLSYAIFKNDLSLVRRVLELVRAAAVASDKDPEIALEEFFVSEREFNRGEFPSRSHLRMALVLGRIKILEELMKTITFGVPYAALAQDDEVYQKAKNPTYYPGLAIRGSRNKEWVQDAYPSMALDQSDRLQKPLQVAAYHAQLATLTWLQSDRPWECLKIFIKNHIGTNKVRLLDEHGAAKLFQKGLGLKTTLLPHITIRGWNEERDGKSRAMLQFLLAANPTAITVKNTIGLTPVLFSIRDGNVPATKELIKFGANLTARDVHGRNILHILLTPYDAVVRRRTAIKEFLAILPPTIVAEAWKQRSCRGSNTPLGAWISRSAASKIHLPTLKYLLTVSSGEGLDVANEQGNTPLHDLILMSQYEAARILLKRFPTLIALENGNGRTAGDIALACFRRSVCSKFPIVESTPRYRVYNTIYKRDIWDFLEGRSRYETNDVKKEKEGTIGKMGVVETWKFVDEFEGNGGKRKLVTLETAEKVAKRIGGIAKMEVSGGTSEGIVGEEDLGDVVTLW